jgi:hypothetical protein
VARWLQRARARTYSWRPPCLPSPRAPRVATNLLQGKPDAEILRVAREQAFDLIVMGTHGRMGLRHILMAQWPNASCVAPRAQSSRSRHSQKTLRLHLLLSTNHGTHTPCMRGHANAIQELSKGVSFEPEDHGRACLAALRLP